MKIKCLSLPKILYFSLVFLITLGLFSGCKEKSINSSLYSSEPQKQFSFLNQSFVLNKTTGKDFIISNFSDIQFSDECYDNNEYSIANNEIEKTINEFHPNLITHTGDMTNTMFDSDALNSPQFQGFLSLFSNLNQPWTTVFGNHDDYGSSKVQMASILEKIKNCLFLANNQNMGFGNFIIRIENENQDLIKALFFMDSHTWISNNEYDYFWETQLAWYQKMVTEMANYYNSTISSVVFAHIPLYEYNDAYSFWKERDFDKNIGFGFKNEDISSPTKSDGFFDLIRANGTTDYICGHNHANNFSVLYKGIRLTFAMKTGIGCYYNSNINGSLIIKIDDNSNVSIDDFYIPIA